MRRLVLYGVILVIAAALVPRPVAAQSLLERLVSPGPLSAAHAKTEAECAACHDPFDKAAQAGLCLGCHEAVAKDLAAGAGLHGRATDGQACKPCHTEHQGRGGAVTVFSLLTFDHARTDFALRGAHGTAACADCHAPGRSYRDAPAVCADCHGGADPHRGGLGEDCAACHDETGWARAGETFDHAKTGFVLAGGHADAACAACHLGGAQAQTPTDCFSCHSLEDAHRGGFGEACGDCHDPSGWDAAFDHARRTGFALTGGHRDAPCLSCHLEPKPAPACAACHAADDAHDGRNGADCARCHGAGDWLVTSFSHRTTRFPLTGAHMAAPCEACHAGAAPPPRACFSCHAAEDRHRGAFGADCAGCHATASWRGARFAHDGTGFPLRGAHRVAACEGCHRPALAGTRCADCHGPDDAHKDTLGRDCAQCHDEASWRSGVRFDHDIATFPLVGLHAVTPCESCHVSRVYSEAPRLCIGCHQRDDAHSGALGRACADCHNPNGWDHWLFDHAATGFALEGGHAGVECADCHEGGGPAPSACAGCHRREDPHRGGFGPDCARCHGVDDWRRAAR